MYLPGKRMRIPSGRIVNASSLPLSKRKLSAPPAISLSGAMATNSAATAALEHSSQQLPQSLQQSSQQSSQQSLQHELHESQEPQSEQALQPQL